MDFNYDNKLDIMIDIKESEKKHYFLFCLRHDDASGAKLNCKQDDKYNIVGSESTATILDLETNKYDGILFYLDKKRRFLKNIIGEENPEKTFKPNHDTLFEDYVY